MTVCVKPLDLPGILLQHGFEVKFQGLKAERVFFHNQTDVNEKYLLKNCNFSEGFMYSLGRGGVKTKITK